MDLPPFSHDPESLLTLARNPRERRFRSITNVTFDASEGLVSLVRGNFGYKTTINLFENNQGEWKYIVGTENVPLLLAFKAFSELNPGAAGNFQISRGSLTNINDLAPEELKNLFDPNAVADPSIPMTIYGDRDGRGSTGFPIYYDENLTGADGDDVLAGLLGRDTMAAGLGNDELYGGYGDDQLFGQDGNDVLYGEQNKDSLYGGAGDDYLDGGLGVDYMSGGVGNDVYVVDNLRDVIDDRGAVTDVDRVLVVSYLEFLLPTNVESGELQGSGDSTILGNLLANDLLGNSGDNLLDGGARPDSLDGGFGNDTLIGGTGNDVMVGGAGLNLFVGGSGNDVFDSTGGVGAADYSATTTAIIASLDAGIARGDGLDSLISVANLISGIGADKLTGDLFRNRLTSGPGSDSVNGGGGNDTLIGASITNSALDVDTLIGGAGSDVFVLAADGKGLYDDQNPATSGNLAYAEIVDFSPGIDQLQLIGSASSYLVGNQPSGETSGLGIYVDSNGSRTLEASDELVAILRTETSLQLNQANTVNRALFI